MLTCIANSSLMILWTVSHDAALHISININYSNCLIMSHLSSMRRANTPIIESHINDEWTSRLFSLQNWCTHWCIISQLIMFLPNTSTNCRWISVAWQFCAHKNRITACGRHIGATSIGNSIFPFWFLCIYWPVHFEIFIVLPQNHTLHVFFFNHRGG